MGLKLLNLLQDLTPNQLLLLAVNVIGVLVVIVVGLILLFMVIKIRGIQKQNDARLRRYVKRKNREIFGLSLGKLHSELSIAWQSLGVCHINNEHTNGCQFISGNFDTLWSFIKSETRHILVTGNTDRCMDAIHENGYNKLNPNDLEEAIRERGMEIYQEAQQDLYDSGIYHNGIISAERENKFQEEEAINFFRKVVNKYLLIHAEEKKQITGVITLPLKIWKWFK